MKMVKKCKKSLIVMMAGIILSSGFAMPAMAHGHAHGNSNDGTYCTSQNKTNCNGTYCAYHDKTHKKKSACKKYCAKHKTTHKNGKRHH